MEGSRAPGRRRADGNGAGPGRRGRGVVGGEAPMAPMDDAGEAGAAPLSAAAAAAAPQPPAAAPPPNGFGPGAGLPRGQHGALPLPGAPASDLPNKLPRPVPAPVQGGGGPPPSEPGWEREGAGARDDAEAAAGEGALAAGRGGAVARRGFWGGVAGVLQCVQCRKPGGTPDERRRAPHGAADAPTGLGSGPGREVRGGGPYEAVVLVAIDERALGGAAGVARLTREIAAAARVHPRPPRALLSSRRGTARAPVQARVQRPAGPLPSPCAPARRPPARTSLQPKSSSAAGLTRSPRPRPRPTPRGALAARAVCSARRGALAPRAHATLCTGAVCAGPDRGGVEPRAQRPVALRTCCLRGALRVRRPLLVRLVKCHSRAHFTGTGPSPHCASERVRCRDKAHKRGHQRR
jgi:hypothetical protein